jgi:hypothetical protein
MDLKAGGGSQEGARISLWKLDRLMNGDLPETEAAKLRERIAASPEALRYLEEYSRLRTELSLQKILSPARAKAPASTHGRTGWEALSRLLLAPGRNRGVRLAFALFAVGAGLWTWSLRERGSGGRTGEDSRYQPKGTEAAQIHLHLRGIEYKPGETGTAQAGDTLSVLYRSPQPLLAAIWFREEGGSPAAMPGNAATLAWPAAAAWSPAPLRIVLEGGWRRQTVWVLTSRTAFSQAEALEALAGKSRRGDLRADAFPLAN